MNNIEFKIGDKVNIPTTKSYKPEYFEPFIRQINEHKPLYGIITDIDDEENQIIVKFLNKNKGDFRFTFTKEDLSLYDSFTLPELWCVNLYPEVKQWIRDTFNSTYYENNNETSIFNFPNFNNINNKKGFEAGEHTGENESYTKITLDQFIKYVLKQYIKEVNDTKSLDHRDGYYTLEEVEAAIKNVLMEDEIDTILEALKNKQFKTKEICGS